jgi:hypothetical protein
LTRVTGDSSQTWTLLSRFFPDSISRRKTSSCTLNEPAIASGSSAHNRVERTISVNRNVTVPDGGKI